MFCITIEHKVVARLFSVNIVKTLSTYYFGYFGHACSLLSKTIMSTCKNFDVYLHAKRTLSLTLFLIHCKLVSLSTLRMLDRVYL